MIKNTTEILVPAPKVVSKEQVLVYISPATYTTPGVAAFNPEQFIISDNVVSLNGNLIDMVNGEGEGAVQQIPNGVAGGFEFGSNKNPNAVEFDPSLNGTIPYGATGDYAASFGGKSAAMGKRAFSEGTTTIAKGAYSHAEGNNSVALGAASHAEGSETTAKANYSHSEGGSTVGGGAYSHAEGLNTIAGDEAAHAEGENTKANARAAHTEGISNTVHAEGAHAEGMGNIIGEAGQPSDAPDTGLYAHVEGSYNYVRGDHAHAEGQNNVIGPGANYAHVSGNDNVAKHAGAHLMGKGLVSGRQNQTVVGQYNEYDDDAMFIVAAGEKYEPHNILVVRPDGAVEFEGKYYDYVVTNRLQFRNIGSLKGRILVKNVTFTEDDSGSVYKVSNDTSLLEFVNTSMESAISFTIEGNSNCKILGLNLPDYASNVEIKNFGSVEDCKLKGHWAGSFVNCTHVENCSAAYITGCKYVINCELISEGDAIVQNCDYVSGIRIYDDAWGTHTDTNVVCRDCNFVSNVDADGTYINCKYVDPNTCRGFIQDEDVGKVQVITNDGSFKTFNVIPFPANWVSTNAVPFFAPAHPNKLQLLGLTKSPEANKMVQRDGNGDLTVRGAVPVTENVAIGALQVANMIGAISQSLITGQNIPAKNSVTDAIGKEETGFFVIVGPTRLAYTLSTTPYEIDSEYHLIFKYYETNSKVYRMIHIYFQAPSLSDLTVLKRNDGVLTTAMSITNLQTRGGARIIKMPMESPK